MIRKKNIVAMAAVAVMAGGCTSGDEVRQKERVPIRLTANVGVEALTRGADGQVVRTEGAVTRGTQETALASGETVYVWAKEDGSSSWDYLKAWTLTADGSTGLSGSSQYYPLDGTGITMNAVHGNFASAPEEGTTAIASLTHSVAADQSAEGGYEKSDLLFGTATGSDASSAENIAFAHKLSKIEVNLTSGYGYDDSDLATAEVRLNNVLPSVAIDPTDGTIGSASGTATTITPRRDGTSYEAVIPPQTFTNPDALISVTTTKDGLTLTSTVPNDVAVFEGNTKYVYDVRIRKMIPLSETTSDNVFWLVTNSGYAYPSLSEIPSYEIPVAMIAYVGSPGSADAKGYRGLAIALTDANLGETCNFCTINTEHCLGTYYGGTDAYNDLNGVAYTQALVNHASHTHVAAQVAINNNGTVVPSGTSGWFLPTIGQWNLILKSLLSNNTELGWDSGVPLYAYDSVNSLLPLGVTGLASHAYWTSTDFSNESYITGVAFCFRANIGKAGNDWKEKTSDKVRSFLAF